MDCNFEDFSKFSPKDMSKILFIFNALEDGWTIKKRNNKYIFSKHKGKTNEIYMDSFLQNFLTKYFKIE